jgi:hypothetical protein
VEGAGACGSPYITVSQKIPGTAIRHEKEIKCIQEKGIRKPLFTCR